MPQHHPSPISNQQRKLQGWRKSTEKREDPKERQRGGQPGAESKETTGCTRKNTQDRRGPGCGRRGAGPGQSPVQPVSHPLSKGGECGSCSGEFSQIQAACSQQCREPGAVLLDITWDFSPGCFLTLRKPLAPTTYPDEFHS